MKKTILHLCADIGSDSRYYQLDPNYEVILIGKDIGVENYHVDKPIYGIIANPVCTEFSTALGFDVVRDIDKGMFLVAECQRVINEAQSFGYLHFWVIENPYNGRLKEILGLPDYSYEPWWYGSPWTKKTALWGNFVIPKRLYWKWDDVPKNENLYVRPGRPKPSLAFLHKSAIKFMPEYAWCAERVVDDMSLRSLCSDGFAKAFYECNK